MVPMEYFETLSPCIFKSIQLHCFTLSHFRCKSYEKARKRLTIFEAPNVLTIALKRFQVILQNIRNDLLLCFTIQQK